MIDKKYITTSREPFFEIAKKLIKSDFKVLDVGAGFGEFSEYCGTTDFFLLDGNSESVEKLKEKHKNVYYSKLPLLPFEDQFFDLIHCSHIVEHLSPQELYDFLKEATRTLKKGGYLVISAPLLWSGFYNDLSHIKPYNPVIFQKYLCERNVKNPTRSRISGEFEMVEIQYRYQDDYSRFNLVNLKPKNIINRFFLSLLFKLKKNGLIFLEVTGFTMVLKKGDI